MRAWSTKMLSVVEYPLRNAAWFSCISEISFEKKFNLVLIIEVNNFPKQLISVIALKLSGSVGQPLFLYTGTMIQVVQVSGIIPVSNTRLNNLV